MLRASTSFLYRLPTTSGNYKRVRLIDCTLVLTRQDSSIHDDTFGQQQKTWQKFLHRQSLSSLLRTKSTRRLSSPISSSSFSLDLVHVLRFDGAISTTYPYKAGAGLILYHVSSGQELLSTHEYLGTLTYDSPIQHDNERIEYEKKLNERSSSPSTSHAMQVNAIVAQGKSLLLGLKHANNMGVRSLVVQGHSPLIQYYLQQQKDEEATKLGQTYKKKDKNQKVSNHIIKDLYQEIVMKMELFDSIQMITIAKGRNAEAIKLAEHAIHMEGATVPVGTGDKPYTREKVSTIPLKKDDCIQEKDTNLTSEIQKMVPTELKKRLSVDPNQYYTLQFDGGSRGNPGLAGAGFVLYIEKKEICTGSYYIGPKHTNNEAEYIALKRGLECCANLGIKRLRVQGDSDLVINHVKGRWKCKKDHLKVFLKEVQAIARDQFESFQIDHIPRIQNGRADELANIAMDSRQTKLSLSQI